MPRSSTRLPIDPRLMEILQEAFDGAAPGEECMIVLGQGGQMGRRLMAIARNAGVEPWPDAFQTLRRSCEKEWAMQFPQFAVSKWIGHSILVSGRHYANSVPDELFDRAAGRQAVQNPVQHAAAGGRTDAQHPAASCRTPRSPSAPAEASAGPEGRAERKKWSRGDSNPRAPSANVPDSKDLREASPEGGAESGALWSRPGIEDDDLRRLLVAWPTLPEPVRADIVAMIGVLVVRAAEPDAACPKA